MAENEGFPAQILVTSIVSGRTFEPLVSVELGIHKFQMGLDEAREHARNIFECAEAAESDAFVFQWLYRDIIGTAEDSAENFEKLISEFAAFREARGAHQKKME